MRASRASRPANELFGAGSNQSQRTAQAFDGVEILAATQAPPPPTAPPVSGADSVLFLSKNGANLVVSRRETGRGDPAQGIFLIPGQPADQEKIAVSGDGTIGFFVTASNDACFFATAGTGSLSCLNLPGSIASVAMSRDTNVYAVVLQSGGGGENVIADRRRSFKARPRRTTSSRQPRTADGATRPVGRHAQLHGQPALSVLRRPRHRDRGGRRRPPGPGASRPLISPTAQTYSIIPPIPGLDIGNPAVASTSDNFFTFEAVNQSDGKASIYAANVRREL